MRRPELFLHRLSLQHPRHLLLPRLSRAVQGLGMRVVCLLFLKALRTNTSFYPYCYLLCTELTNFLSSFVFTIICIIFIAILIIYSDICIHLIVRGISTVTVDRLFYR